MGGEYEVVMEREIYYSLTYDYCPNCGLVLVLPDDPHLNHEWSRHTIKQVICKQCGKILSWDDYLRAIGVIPKGE